MGQNWIEVYEVAGVYDVRLCTVESEVEPNVKVKCETAHSAAEAAAVVEWWIKDGLLK